MSDIDEVINALKVEKAKQDSLFQVAQYVSTHLDELDSLSDDTLSMAFEYLYNTNTERDWMSDAKEKSFNSGIDARLNLGNNQFYDNMQACYYMRRMFINIIQTARDFRQPWRCSIFSSPMSRRWLR